MKTRLLIRFVGTMALGLVLTVVVIAQEPDQAQKSTDQPVSGWRVETVDSEGSVGLCFSLALDKDGYPHNSYFYHTGQMSSTHIETHPGGTSTRWPM